MIAVKNLSLNLGGKSILRNVTVNIPKGRIVVFIGSSGAGKTSLMNCIAQVYTHYTGDVFLNDKDVKQLSAKQRAQKMGFVFQHGYLFPHVSVLANCVQPQVLNGVAPVIAHENAIKKLEELTIARLAEVYPHQLSGGQQQRVAIARALCLTPMVLLLDEPSSALDPQNTKLLAALLCKLNSSGVTIGLCSHDVLLVKQLLDCVYLLEQGSVVEYCDIKNKTSHVGGQIEKFLSH